MAYCTDIASTGAAAAAVAGVSGIADGLMNTSAGLTLLDLSSNQLSSTGVAALAAAIARHPAGAAAVQHLVLADNPGIDDDAICRLAESLKAPVGSAAADSAEEETKQQQQQQQLKLDLAHAGVAAEGIAALSKVSGLTQLSLFGCKLGGEPGGQMIGTAAMLCTGFQVLAMHATCTLVWVVMCQLRDITFWRT
jgi:hypothetical protein